MNFFNRDDNNKNSSGFKGLKQKKTKVKIILFISTIFLALFLFIILIACIAAPAFFFVDTVSNWFDGIKKFFTGNQNFSEAILDKEKYYNETVSPSVQIDKELAMSVLFYESGLDFTGDYTVSNDCDVENDSTCIDKATNKRLIKNAKKLVDGMVKEEYRWTCRHYEVVTKTTCTDNSSNSDTIKQEVSKTDSNNKKKFTYLLNIAMNTTIDGSGGGSTTITKPSGQTCTKTTYNDYSPWLECGYTVSDGLDLDEVIYEDNGMCDNTCSPSFEKKHTLERNLKTKEEFITWLKLSSSEKDEYGDKGYDLAAKLEEDGAVIPEDETEREKYLDAAIEDIYDIYELTKTTEYSYGDFPSLNYVSGSFNGQIYSWNQCDKSYADALGYQIIPGNNRTYCSGGCALASTAAIVSSLSGSEVNPVTIGNKYGNSTRCVSGGCYGFEIVKDAAADYGFTTSYQFSGSDTVMLQTMINKLAEGESLVMVRVGPGSISSGYHFIVLTGVNEDGTVTMADSGQPSNNNRSWTLEEIAQSALGYMIISR